jgi:hypothetical protein
MNLIAAILLTASVALPPAPVVPMPIDEPARALLANFNAGKFDEASKDFNDKMRVTVPPALMAKLKQQLDAESGAFKKVTDLRHLKLDGFRVVQFLCRYEKGDVSFQVLFDGTDHVGSIALKRIVEDSVDTGIEAMARELLDDLTAKRYDAAGKNFNDNMRAQVNPARLAQLGSSVQEQFGAFVSVKKVVQRPQDTYRVIDLISVYERSPVTFSVVFDASGKIAGVHINPTAP